MGVRKTDKSVLQWHASLRETSNKQTNPHAAQRLVLRESKDDKGTAMRNGTEKGLGIVTSTWKPPRGSESRENKFKKVKFW